MGKMKPVKLAKNGKVYDQEGENPLIDGHIRILPSKTKGGKFGLYLARGYFPMLELIGAKKIKKTTEQKADLLKSLPCNVFVVDNELTLSVYVPNEENLKEYKAKLYNFMITGLPKNVCQDIRDYINKMGEGEFFSKGFRFDLEESQPPRPVPDRNPNVIHFTFDLTSLKRVFTEQKDWVSWLK